jgi:signal transduction histidine kinase
VTAGRPVAWARHLVTALVLGGGAVVVAGLVVRVATAGAGPVLGLEQVPLWALAAAVAVVAVLAPAAHRVIDPAVADLLAADPDPVGSALAEVERQVDAGPAALLQALAATAARALRAPHVRVETLPDRSADGGPDWSDAMTASCGALPAGAALSVHPVVHRGEVVARLHVGGRVPDDARVADVVRLLALALHAARTGSALRGARERMLRTREEERRRLRRDLHDGLGPTLAALKLQVGALRRSGAVPPAAVDVLTEGLDEATAEVRRLVHDLRPPMLDDLGMAESLRHLRFVPPELDLRVEVDPALPALPAAVEVALHRIATEAVHNVVRHAGASRCTVRLAGGAGAVRLDVTDDGAGCPPTAAPGAGRRAMAERAEELGGELRLGPGGDGGTRVTAVVPLGASA